MAGLKFDITGDNSNMLSALQGVQNGVRQTQRVVEQSGTGIEQTFSKIQSAATAAMGAFSAQQFASKIMSIRGEFQQLEVAFQTMLGSADKASTLMNQLVKTAATTPFDLKGVADGAKQLLAYGTQASEVNETIVRLGDIAAGLSIPLGDLVYLYGTTMTQGRMFTMDLRQFMGRGIPMAEELAKIFGVTKNEVAGLVTAGKVGSAEVKLAIENMTSAGGKFGGLMEAQSHTITGQISNIEDAIDMMYNDIGKQSEGFINTALGGVSTLVENYKAVGGVLVTLVSSYGAYKAALMATVAIQNAQQKFRSTAELDMLQEEINKTNALLPAKSAAANADLREAVSKKQLTQAQAELIAAKREELGIAKGNTMLAPINEEIASIQALLAEKKATQNADLQEAVASGTLTQEMANEVAQRRELLLSLQEQLSAKQQLLKQNVSNATSNLADAEKELYLAEEKHQLAQEDLSLAYQHKEAADAQVQAAMEYLNAQEAINEYEDTTLGDTDGYDKLQIALSEQRAAAEQLKTASENENSAALALNSAQEQVNTAEKELNTAQTDLNAVSQTKDTTAKTVNTTATSGNTLATKTNTIAMSISAVQAKASAVAQTVFAIAVNGVKNAWEAMKIAMMTNPIGAIIGAVSIAIGLFMTFSDATDDAANSTEKYGETADESASKVKGLYAILESDATHTSKVQKDTMNELKSLADEYGLTLDNEKDLYTQLISKKEELIGLIKEESIERQKANDITAIGDAYQKNLEDIKDKIKDSLSDAFSDIQKNQLVTLIDDASLDNIQKKLKAMNEATAESVKITGSWKSSISIDAIAAYNMAVSELTNKIAIYAERVTGSSEAGREAKSVVESQAYALSHTRDEYVNNIETVNRTAEAAQSATIATSRMSEAQMELADRTKLANQDVDTLGSTIDEIIKAYNEANINLNISYTELNSPPKWMTGVADRMTSKQLGNLAAYHQARADKAKNHRIRSGRRLVQRNAQGSYTTERQEQVMAGQYSILARKKKQEEDRKAAKDQKKRNNRPQKKQKHKSNKTADEAKRKAEEAKREAERIAEETRERNKAIKDYEKSILEQQKETELALRQQNIDLKEESYEKEVEQINLNYDRLIAENEKRRKDMIEALKDKKVNEWLNKNPKATKEQQDSYRDSLNLTENDLSVKQKSQLDEYDRIAKDKKKKSIDDVYKSQLLALNEYLKEYGSFEKKKLAITQEYEEKIRKASTIGEKATLEMQRDKEIENLKNDGLKNTIDWSGVFSDLQGHTKKYLQDIRSQLQDLLKSGNLPIDQMQTISEKIYAIDDELGKQQGIWDFVGERTREHNRRLQEAADAQERLNVARNQEATEALRLNEVKQEAQKQLSSTGINMSLDEISTSSLNGKIDLTDEKFKSMSLILQKLAIAEAKLAEARKNTITATNKAKQAEDGAKRKSAQGVADWFSNVQDFITKKGIDQLPDLLSSVGLGGIGDKVGKGLDGFNNAAGAAEDFASGNYVGAALKGLSAIKSFGSMLGIGGGNEKAVAETTERLAKSNEYLKNSIDSLKEKIDKSNGSKAVDSYQKAVDNQKQVIENTMDILKAQMSYHSAHHSNRYYWNLSKSDYAAINSTLAKYAKDNPTAETRRNSVSSLYDIYQLTPEQMKAIADEQVKIWQKMLEAGKYDKSEYWENYIALAGKLEELTEKISDNLTQTSFDSLHDDFVNTIMDMNATASDFSNNFTQMMAKAWTNAAVGNLMDDELKKFYAKWAEKMQSKDADGNSVNFSKDEIDEMRAEYQALVNQALSIRETMSQVTGYTGQSSEQKATANGISSITYEQANNIVALTTAGNITREQIKDLVASVMASVSSMANVSSSTNTAVLEIRNLMIYNNSYLEDILKCSKTIYSEFATKLDNVNKNLKDLK